jgi:hypothetical protein
MNARVRRNHARARSAASFGKAHPDPSPGFSAAQGALETGVERADALATQQRNGTIIEGAANGRKNRYREKVLPPVLSHLIRVAVVASKEVPELALKFQLPNDDSYASFRTAIGGMAEAARVHLDLMVRYGLVESLLTTLEQTIVQMDQATVEEDEGRRAHVGASADLEVVAQDLVKLVKVMDGLNRFRFAEDAEKLAAWDSASNVITHNRAVTATPKPGEGSTTPPVAGQITPAPAPTTPAAHQNTPAA